MYGYKTRLLAAGAPVVLAALALAGAAHAGDTATAADAGASAGSAASAQAVVDEVVVTGVRGQPRTIANSPVPIDIITSAQLTATGKVGLKQILSNVIPSLNVPAQNGGGVSASVPPYTVEGLTGDYVLVLVNGKRRHNTGLINNLATVGGGATPVDLDLIPPSAIDHIEYLRDGAAAQYGSDAITGVINIILKGASEGGSADTQFGQTYKSAGRAYQENADWGAPLLGGALHLGLSYVHNSPAPANIASGGLLYPAVGGAPDPREASANTNYGSAYGRSTTSDTIQASYNLTVPIGHDLEAYSFATFAYRNILDARGAYRPDDLAALPQIFPNGFQAYRLIRETDFQFNAGVKGHLFGWDWDLSSQFGRDYDWLGAHNTLNASLGPSVTQTDFFMGVQYFNQWVNNLDVTRSFNVGFAKPLDVSWGFEHRWEQFSEQAGELNSWANGIGNNQIPYVVPNDGSPFGNLWHGVAEQPGLQSFTGTTPADASTHSRNNFAGYVDLGTNLTSAWYVGLAGRVEHFDDSSGNTATGKFTTRYEILPGLALRGSVNTGFHAPSLAEEWFSTTQNTIQTIGAAQQQSAVLSKFLPVGNPVAAALGATPLRPETSFNYSVGLTYEPIHRLRFTVDAYEIDLSNRIVKSSALTLSLAQKTQFGLQNIPTVTGQFFINGVNTRTRGVDAVAEYQQSLGDFGSVNWSAIFSGNGTEVTHVTNQTLFNALAQQQLVEQAPRYRVSLGGDWTIGQWSVRLQQTLWGPYEEPITLNSTKTGSVDEVFHPKWVTDLDVSYRVTPKLTLSAGANNLFNAYPSRVSDTLLAKTSYVDTQLQTAPGYKAAPAVYGVPTSGGAIYGTVAPFGLLGGFYYVRVGVKF
jgi:iron complex outermembrane receptor protein